MKGRALVAIGVALLVLAVFIVLVGWQDVLGAVARAAVLVYAGAFLGMAWCLAFRGYVWHRLLGAVDTPRPYWLVGGVFLTAMFAKYVTPYGQVTSGVGMAAVVSRYYESAYEESLAAILSADFLNYLPYYTFGGLGVGYLLVIDAPPIDPRPYLRSVGMIVAALTAVALAVLWLGRNDTVRPGIGTIRDRIVRRGGTLRELAERLRGFSETVSILSRDRRTILVAAAAGHLAWLGLAGALYFSALAVGHELPIGIVFLSVALSKLGFIVPTPGGVGGVEIALASVLFLLTPMSGGVATAVAILYRFATYWFTVLVGGSTSVLLTIVDPTPP